MTLPPRLDWPDAGIGPGLEVPTDRRVTRDNWRIYPWSRWAFQHTRELVPSRGLPPSDKPRRLVEQLADLDRLRFDGGDGATISWREFEERTFADGVVVLHRGVVVHERYLNGMTPGSVHHAFSVTKSFVGLLAEILIARGVLDASAPVVDILPELGGSAFEVASVRDLLDMTDGVAFGEDYADPQSDVHRYSASYWTPGVANGGARATLATLARRAHAPGDGFSYRTPIADALGWVVARAGRKRLTDLFVEHVWHPAGCADDGHFLLDVAGDEIAASGLNASLRDMARLASFVMDSAAIPDAARTSILRGGNRALFAASTHAARSAGSYRSQWWVAHDDHRSISALGVYGQRLHLETETGLALVRFGSHPVASNLATDDLHRRAIAALRAFLF